MRRLVLSLAVVCASAVFSACAGSGGYAFNNTNGGKIDRIVFSAGNAAGGIFKLAANPTQPLLIAAVGVKGSQNSIVPDQTFVWSASLASGGQVYGNNVNGVTGTCPVPAAGSIINQGAVTSPIVLRFPATSAITGSSPTGTPSIASNLAPYDPAFQSDSVFVIPLNNVPSPYCLTIQATHSSDGVFGTQVVFVGN